MKAIKAYIRPGMSEIGDTEKSSMRLTITRQIALLLFLSTCGALLTLGAVYRFLSQMEGEGAFLNVVGRQRMLCEQLGAYAHMVQMGQEEDRKPLQGLVGEFEQALQVLRQGGAVLEHVLLPAPPEVEAELIAVVERWQQLKAALLAMTSRTVDDPQRQWWPTPRYRSVSPG